MNKKKCLIRFLQKTKKQKNIFGVKRKIGKFKKKCVLSGIKGVDKKCHVENDKKKKVSFIMKNVCLNKGGSR